MQSKIKIRRSEVRGKEARRELADYDALCLVLHPTSEEIFRKQEYESKMISAGWVIDVVAQRLARNERRRRADAAKKRAAKIAASRGGGGGGGSSSPSADDSDDGSGSPSPSADDDAAAQAAVEDALERCIAECGGGLRP